MFDKYFFLITSDPYALHLTPWSICHFNMNYYCCFYWNWPLLRSVFYGHPYHLINTITQVSPFMAGIGQPVGITKDPLTHLCQNTLIIIRKWTVKLCIMIWKIAIIITKRAVLLILFLQWSSIPNLRRSFQQRQLKLSLNMSWIVH